MFIGAESLSRLSEEYIHPPTAVISIPLALAKVGMIIFVIHNTLI